MQFALQVSDSRSKRAKRAVSVAVLALLSVAALAAFTASQGHADETLTLAVAYGTHDDRGAFTKTGESRIPLVQDEGRFEGKVDVSKLQGGDVRWSLYRTEGDLCYSISDFEFDPDTGTVSIPDSTDPVSLTFECSVPGSSSNAPRVRFRSALTTQSSSSIPNTVYYKHGHGVYYGLPGGRSTQTYTVETPDGDELVAYCVNPPKGWVGEQDLHTIGLSDFAGGIHDIDMLAMVLYYGVGGPGYDSSMWPTMPSDYFGSSTDTARERHYCCVHVLASLATYGDETIAFDQCSSGFVSWFNDKIRGDVVDEMESRWSELSSSLRAIYRDSCFMLDPTNLDGKHDNAQELAVASATLPVGYIELVKKSSNTSITSGNSCYSLKDAVYGVFETKAKATGRKRSDALATAKTGEGGKARFEDELAVGTYYVTEITPSSGYQLDETVYTVKVSSGQTSKVNGSSGVVERPVDCPIAIMVAKWDATLGKAAPQGAASLSGAQFTVRFYAGSYSASNLPGSATRTWVLKTAADGVIRFQDAARLKVSGDDFYRNADGQVTLPLGTVSIVETKAPLGYNLKAGDGSDPKLHVLRVVADGSASTGASVEALNYSGNITESNTPIVSEIVKRGDYRLVKEASTEIDEQSPQEQARILMKGIQFQLINDNENAVASPQTGREVGRGDVVCTITTDDNGLASTKSGSNPNGWKAPSGWSGALAFGTYIVHEVIPDSVQESFEHEHGTRLSPVDDWKVVIGEEGQYDPAPLVNNKIPQSPLKVVKVDAETGVQIPLPVSFQLFDAKGDLVTYTSHYPEDSTIDTWTANERGEVTLPMLLEGGDYRLREVQAPDGYALSEEDVAFTVDEYRTWDDPVTVTFEDTPIMGIIALEKADAETGEAVAGAQYVIVAAEDITTPEGTVRKPEGETVAVLVTDADGTATSPELYLGAYTVYETKPPEGYALDVEEHAVAIASEGQDVPVVTVRAELVDVPTQLLIEKVDSETGEPLADAVFKVKRDDSGQGEEGQSGEGGAEEGSDEPDGQDDGRGDTQSDGEDGQPAASGSGGDGGGASADAQDGDAGAGTSDGNAGDDAQGDSAQGDGAEETEWELVSDEDGVAKLGYLHHGNYVVEEVRAPNGYHLASSDAKLAFTVNDQGFIGEEGKGFTDKLTLTLANQRNEIGTTASVDGAKTAVADGPVKLVDVVTYKGCTPGKEYTVSGVLHRAETALDGSRTDAGEVLDANGKPITSTVTFTPDGQEGSVEVVFEFDASVVGESSVVVFETMKQQDTVFAVHEDITDEGQTVTFVPKEKDKKKKEKRTPTIGTTATNDTDGRKSVDPGAEAAIVDDVAYAGLEPGKVYEVEGVLHFVTTDRHGMKTDGGVVKDHSGNPVRANTFFTATKERGHAKVRFKFDARELDGRDVVVFETLFEQVGESDRKKVVDHADVADEGQTVAIGKPSSKPSGGSTLPTTGDLLGRYWWVLAILISTSLVITGIVAIQMIRNRR